MLKKKKFAENILHKTNKKKIIVGVVGLGYVGLPLSILISKNGYIVYGFDTDINKIKNINLKKSYIDRISNKDVELIAKKGKFFNEINKIADCDIIIICVPTPLKKNKPDLKYLRDTVTSIKP